MKLDKFTIKSQEAIQSGVGVATELSHQSVEIGHLFKGIILADEDITPFVFKKLGVNYENFSAALTAYLESLPKVSGGNQYLSSNAQSMLQKAISLAGKMKDEYVAIEHILLAVVESKSKVADMLKDAGFSSAELKKAIEQLRKGGHANSASAESSYNALNKFAVHLNERAKSGKLDPVIGRDDEIRRVLQILSRRTKNNPILIGEPGVGKTAIAEGLAHRIVNGDVPENLKSKQIYSLDMGALIAGAKYKGEFEERLKSVVKEVIHSDGEIVLFIDEIHTLVGAGASEGAMDAANILKPALARGELRAVGATTLAEYQKYFEKDKALERRFQTVMVDEPNTADAISILRGLKERYETHHKVRITDEAIISAVELSQRYITERFLPDKAIDLIDEAASKLKMEINSMPAELDEVTRKIRQLEIENEAIKREKDKDKLQHIQKELAELRQEESSLKAKWQTEREVVEGIQAAKEEMEELKIQAEQAEREGNLGLVAEIRYGKLAEAEKKLTEYSEKWKIMQEAGDSMIKEEVEAEDIAVIISSWTGIPLKRMLQSEKEKLLHLEEELHKRVVGQDQAIEAVSDAVRRNRAGLGDENRPIGSFIFLGTTGVGKTELAKALAEYLFNNENAITRIDMSEYQERHSVSRLVGAPPGYVGYDEGGQLTEAVRRKPYSVILLDEIEKAHPDVFNILLQVLDDGRLTDNKGRVANFKNSIIIMTSNLGSTAIQEAYDNIGHVDRESFMEKINLDIREVLKQHMRPEFLNRIDETIVFTPLSKNEIGSIVTLQFSKLQEHLKEKNIHLTATKEAMSHLAEIGFDPQFGARPVKRIIQKEILNTLSKDLISGRVVPGMEVVMDYFEDGFVFRQPINNAEKSSNESKEEKDSNIKDTGGVEVN